MDSPDTAAALRPVLPAVADEIVTAIQREVPAYSRAFEGPFGQVIRDGVQRGLARFVDELEDHGRHDVGERRLYVDLGRGEFRAGRSLEALLAAYRIGARVAWRRFVDAGVARGVEPAQLYDLGEAVFAYIDGLSAESAEGYAAEQSATAGEAEVRRRALVRALAADPPVEDEVRALAATAGWVLPRRLAVLVSAAADERVAARMGADALAARLDGLTVVVVPDPDGPGRGARLQEALRGRRAALGPAVGWREAAHSLERARRALALADRLGDAVLVRAEEHLVELLLAADPQLAADVAARALAPLEDATPAARARLLETLRAWLDHQGRVEAAAHALGVHPQTVRYRLGQLRERLPGLEDPATRFELAVALRVTPAP
jgi:hypothetical protein